MALTATAIKNAKPGSKPAKLYDSKGLFLLIQPNGGKWWRYRYRRDGKEKLLSLGTYPDVSLAKARQQRDEARALLLDGIDPAAARKAEKAQSSDAAATTFDAIARQWHAEKARAGWSASNAATILHRLEVYVFPFIGTQPIASVKAADLRDVLRKLEERGTIETARRVKQYCGQVFRYAVAENLCETDPTSALRDQLSAPRAKRHHASITEPRAVGELLRAIHDYSGAYVTQLALKLAPLVFVRPGELRQGEWSEIDLEAAEWRITAERMKMKATHIVPLSTQAVALLSELKQHTGHGRYLFPGLRTRSRPMSENTINAALRRIGYSKDEMTGHGFRSMASTLLNEQGWNRDAIERQLAHGERNGVRAAYNYAEYLPERRKMMQAWADYLDGLRSTGAVVPLNSARRVA